MVAFELIVGQMLRAIKGRLIVAINRNKLAGRYLAQFPSALDDAIRSTPEDAGVLDDYTNAVDEYRKAMKLNDLWEATKEQGVRILKYAIPGAATAHAIKSAVSL